MILSNLLSRLLRRTLRRDWLFYLLLVPGTILHELSHATMSLVFLVPVREVHLFRLRREPDGTVQLGEVVHADADPIRNFFIAVAPLLGASVLIYFLSVWLLPKNESWEILLRSGWTYVFLVVVFFLALGLSPSRQDLKAVPGFLAVAVVLGLAGYFLVRLIASEYNLSGVEKTISNALRTANMGMFTPYRRHLDRLGAVRTGLLPERQKGWARGDGGRTVSSASQPRSNSRTRCLPRRGLPPAPAANPRTSA